MTKHDHHERARAALPLWAGALALMLAAGCASSEPQGRDQQAHDQHVAQHEETAVTVDASKLAGSTDRGAIMSYQRWQDAFATAEVDEANARALAEVAPGARVVVYLGAWCGDSVRELTRFWRALDVVDNQVPFAVEYVAVDQGFGAGDVPLEGVNLEAVPTFVVWRDGQEVGRVVERAPSAAIEVDLRRLLTGEASGVLSATR